MNTRSTELSSASLGTGFWDAAPKLCRGQLLIDNLARANEIIVDHACHRPDSELLTLIVMAAVEAGALLYAASVRPPSRELMNRRFVEFICDALEEEEA